MNGQYMNNQSQSISILSCNSLFQQRPPLGNFGVIEGLVTASTPIAAIYNGQLQLGEWVDQLTHQSPPGGITFGQINEVYEFNLYKVIKPKVIYSRYTSRVLPDVSSSQNLNTNGYYPHISFKIDYDSCCVGQMTLLLTTDISVKDSLEPVSIYGYASQAAPVQVPRSQIQSIQIAYGNDFIYNYINNISIGFAATGGNAVITHQDIPIEIAKIYHSVIEGPGVSQTIRRAVREDVFSIQHNPYHQYGNFSFAVKADNQLTDFTNIDQSKQQITRSQVQFPGRFGFNEIAMYWVDAKVKEININQTNYSQYDANEQNWTIGAVAPKISDWQLISNDKRGQDAEPNTKYLSTFNLQHISSLTFGSVKTKYTFNALDSDLASGVFGNYYVQVNSTPDIRDESQILAGNYNGITASNFREITQAPTITLKCREISSKPGENYLTGIQPLPILCISSQDLQQSSKSLTQYVSTLLAPNNEQFTYPITIKVTYGTAGYIEYDYYQILFTNIDTGLLQIMQLIDVSPTANSNQYILPVGKQQLIVSSEGQFGQTISETIDFHVAKAAYNASETTSATALLTIQNASDTFADDKPIPGDNSTKFAVIYTNSIIVQDIINTDFSSSVQLLQRNVVSFNALNTLNIANQDLQFVASNSGEQSPYTVNISIQQGSTQSQFAFLAADIQMEQGSMPFYLFTNKTNIREFVKTLSMEIQQNLFNLTGAISPYLNAGSLNYINLEIEKYDENDFALNGLAWYYTINANNDNTYNRLPHPMGQQQQLGIYRYNAAVLMNHDNEEFHPTIMNQDYQSIHTYRESHGVIDFLFPLDFLFICQGVRNSFPHYACSAQSIVVRFDFINPLSLMNVCMAVNPSAIDPLDTGRDARIYVNRFNNTAILQNNINNNGAVLLYQRYQWIPDLLDIITEYNFYAWVIKNYEKVQRIINMHQLGSYQELIRYTRSVFYTKIWAFIVNPETVMTIDAQGNFINAVPVEINRYHLPIQDVLNYEFIRPYQANAMGPLARHGYNKMMNSVYNLIPFESVKMETDSNIQMTDELPYRFQMFNDYLMLDHTQVHSALPFNNLLQFNLDPVYYQEGAPNALYSPAYAPQFKILYKPKNTQFQVENYGVIVISECVNISYINDHVILCKYITNN